MSMHQETIPAVCVDGPNDGGEVDVLPNCKLIVYETIGGNRANYGLIHPNTNPRRYQFIGYTTPEKTK